MSSSAKRRAIVRQWELVQLMQSSRMGVTPRAAREKLGISRTTFYDYVKTLENAGVPIVADNKNGEARYKLERRALPPLEATASRLAALGLGRQLFRSRAPSW